MVLNDAFVISRNKHKRPTLQHKVNVDDTNFTLCGTPMHEWSRHYMRSGIDELLCMRCAGTSRVPAPKKTAKMPVPIRRKVA